MDYDALRDLYPSLLTAEQHRAIDKIVAARTRIRTLSTRVVTDGEWSEIKRTRTTYGFHIRGTVSNPWDEEALDTRFDAFGCITRARYIMNRLVIGKPIYAHSVYAGENVMSYSGSTAAELLVAIPNKKLIKALASFCVPEPYSGPRWPYVPEEHASRSLCIPEVVRPDIVSHMLVLERRGLSRAEAAERMRELLDQAISEMSPLALQGYVIMNAMVIGIAVGDHLTARYAVATPEEVEDLIAGIDSYLDASS